MTLAFALIAILTIASAVAAMTLRNLVHCSLAASLTFIGLAAAFLQLDAQFAGFAQILVYVGAVAILIVFTVLLTRGGEPGAEPVFSGRWLAGIGVAVAVFAVLAGCVMASGFTRAENPGPAEAPVKGIGDALMTKYVLPLEVLALLLTAAMIGAVIIAMRDKEVEP
jgi:NADH-quinone oxidoreductase subunit J